MRTCNRCSLRGSVVGVTVVKVTGMPTARAAAGALLNSAGDVEPAHLDALAVAPELALHGFRPVEEGALARGVDLEQDRGAEIAEDIGRARQMLEPSGVKDGDGEMLAAGIARQHVRIDGAAKQAWG